LSFVIWDFTLAGSAPATTNYSALAHTIRRLGKGDVHPAAARIHGKIAAGFLNGRLDSEYHFSFASLFYE